MSLRLGHCRDENSRVSDSKYYFGNMYVRMCTYL